MYWYVLDSLSFWGTVILESIYLLALIPVEIWHTFETSCVLMFICYGFLSNNLFITRVVYSPPLLL